MNRAFTPRQKGQKSAHHCLSKKRDVHNNLTIEGHVLARLVLHDVLETSLSRVWEHSCTHQGSGYDAEVRNVKEHRKIHTGENTCGAPKHN